MRPQEAIGYWLASAYRSLSNAFVEFLRMHCQERGKSYVITPAQFGVLAVLNHDGDQKIGAIAQSLRVDLATMTGIVNRLEQIGLVERAHGQIDRRVVTVGLTAEGQDIVSSAYAVAKAYNERVLRDFSDDERKALVGYLQRIGENASIEAASQRLSDVET